MPPEFRASADAHRCEKGWTWRVEARCRGEDPALFFHPDGERGKARKHRQRLAKRICADCPVISQCRQHAIAFQESFGTWGGMAEDERIGVLSSAAVHLRAHRNPSPKVRG